MLYLLYVPAVVASHKDCRTPHCATPFEFIHYHTKVKIKVTRRGIIRNPTRVLVVVVDIIQVHLGGGSIMEMCCLSRTTITTMQKCYYY